MKPTSLKSSTPLLEQAQLVTKFAYDAKRLQRFLNEKEEHRAVLLNGTDEERQKSTEELNSLLSLEHRWKNYPEWYIGIRAYMRDLKDLRESTSPSPGKLSLAKSQLPHFPRIYAESPLEQKILHPPEAEKPITITTEILTTNTETIKAEPINKKITASAPHGSVPLAPRRFSIADLDAFYERHNFVGEKSARTLLLYAALGGAHAGIESCSGAGKSALLYTFLKLLPSDSYLLLKRSTDKALFNDPDINRYRFLIATELQKIPDGLKEDLKDLTEGVDSVYRRTNKNKDGIDVLKVTSGKIVLYTLAITNDYFRKKDHELSRRFIVLPTDISKDQNVAVAEAFAQHEFQKSRPEEQGSDDTIRQHLAQCFELQLEHKNPFLGYLLRNQPEEITGNVRYRSFVKHLQKLVEGCTLYHHPQRVKEDGLVFADLEDNRQVMGFYGQLFYDNVVGISVVDRLVLNSLEQGVQYQSKDALERIAQQGFYDRTTVIEDCLEHLRDLRFLALGKGTVEKIKDRSTYQELDWSEALQTADESMKQPYGSVRNRWLENCRTSLKNESGDLNEPNEPKRSEQK